MFKELNAIARHTPIHLAITPHEGGRLKVIVTPLPTGKAKDYEGLSKQFSVAGTPEELDEGFIATLNTYATKVNEVRAEVNLPLDELDKVKEAAAKKDAKAQKKADEAAAEDKRKKEASEKRATAAAEKKAEAERKKTEAAERRAAKKKGPGIDLPGASAASAAPTSAKPSLPAHLANLPGKPEVLADFRAMKAKHGDKALKRKFFIKKSDTGRRYEKLWPTWADFMAEVDQIALPLEPADENTKRILAAGAKDAAPLDTAVAETPAPRPAKHIVVLERATKKLLGTYLGEPEQGEFISLTDRAGKFLVDSVIPNVEIIAHEVLAEPYTFKDEAGTPIGSAGEIYAVGDKVTAAAPEGEDWRVLTVDADARVYTLHNAARKFKVFTEDDELIIEYKHAPQIGEKLTVPGRAHQFRVLSVEDHRVIARMVLPTRNRIVDHASAELLGHTDEVYDVADQVAELQPKDFRVVKVELDAYVVKLSKPRITGPVAAIATPASE